MEGEQVLCKRTVINFLGVRMALDVFFRLFCFNSQVIEYSIKKLFWKLELKWLDNFVNLEDLLNGWLHIHNTFYYI